MQSLIIPSIADLSKSAIENISTNIVTNVIEGFEDALELDLRLKYLEEVIKSAREKINEQVQKESIGISEKHGVKISSRKGYAVLDFDSDRECYELKVKLEERKSLLSQAFKSTHNLVTDEGEVIPKLPIKNYTKDSVSYTFKK